MSDGLSHAAVHALLQDSLGFLWIGTQDGLNRYDGAGFRVYRHRPGDASSLRDDYVLSLAQSGDGRIWIGTEAGGLQSLDPFTDSIRDFPLPELGPWNTESPTLRQEERVGRTVSSILVREDGSFLLLTDAGVAAFDPLTGSAELVLPLVGSEAVPSHVTAMGLVGDGRVLASLSDGRMAVVDRAGGIGLLPFALPDSAAAVVPSPRGFWVATAQGSLFLVDEALTSAQEVVRLPGAAPDRVIHDVLAMDDGSLWVATTGWAFLVDPDNRAAARVGDSGGARGLPDSEVYQILLDRTGVLWFGTWGGLARIHPLGTSIARVAAGEDLGGHGVITLTDGASGAVWLGTLGGGVLHLRVPERGGDIDLTRPPALAPLGDALVFGLSSESDGALWIAGFTDGFWSLSPDGKATSLPVVDRGTPVRSVTAYSVFVDHAGEVWGGTDPMGLVRLDRDARVFRPFDGQIPDWSPGSDYVWPIAEDAQGRLWIGAYYGGLSVISADRTTAYRYVPTEGGLSSGRILTLFVDARDDIWIGTEGDGLNRLDPSSGSFTLWSTDTGLPHDHVEGIVEDDDGRLWVTTNDGAARMDLESGRILTLREPAGLAGNRFYANGAHRAPDGRLYFAGPDGVTIVDPSTIETTGTVPTVALTAFRIQGRDAPLARAVRTDELVLKPDENFFAFDFAAMDFADVSQNRYRYKLEGLDPDWVDAGNTPVANYTSVPAASYVFRVAARNSEGIWNGNALALPIRVQAHYYATWWFRSLVLLSVLSLVMAFYTYRLRQLEARQRLRLEIAGKLHDDIGANLSNIALKAEMVRTAAELDDRRRKVLSDVGRLSRETAHKVRETVWAVNTRYDTLPKLLGHMHDTADTLLSGHVEYSFSAPENVPDRPISMEFRQNVHLLFKEALNNVVKHAAASRVDVTVTLDQKVLGFRVADDGRGFDAASAREGNGQKLMQVRAAAVRGHLQVTSTPGAGTEVAFSARLR